MPFGVMAIVDYVRDEEGSPTAAAVVDFLKRYGSPRAHSPPDYAAELRTATGFTDFRYAIESVTLQLTPRDFLGLAFSSSHARAAIQTLGKEAAENLLLKSIGRSICGGGRIPYGYRFRMFAVQFDASGQNLIPPG